MRRFGDGTLRITIITVFLVVGYVSTQAQVQAEDHRWQMGPTIVDVSETSDAADFRLLLDPGPNDPEQRVVQGSTSENHGFIMRNVRRGLEDQKELYQAPFKVKNLKWDALFLGTTAALLATDRQVMREVPKDNVNIGHDVALVMLLGTGASAGVTWLYGLKKDDSHAKETGVLTLESLANTFLIYTPMQFAAGRERPDEANGNGRFWRHGGFNTSFPAGHPMFTWAMASVMAHEYPKTWVKILSYGAALAVSGGRLQGRNHFPSDVWVGSIFGYLIGTHIFHAHCDPQFSEACHRQSDTR